MDDTRTLFEILVPCQWNDGTPIRTRHHREWDRRVRKITNGLTIMRPAKGQWIHKDELYEDRVIPVRLCCKPSDMVEIANITIAHYEQKAVMYYEISTWCVIQNATSNQEKKFTHVRNTVATEIANALNSDHQCS